jgi:hypothetical protein
MARIRTIKPEFFTSDDICALSPLARLLYVGLWCEADRAGRMVWMPRVFKRRYLPDDPCDVEALAGELLARGLVVLYGEGLACIPSFARHQHVNPREAASKLPPPDDDHASSRADRASERAGDAQGGREGNGQGKEGEWEEAREGGHAHALPENWKPDEEDLAWAATARRDLTPAFLEAETERFRNHALANGRTAHRWGPNWRNWIARAHAPREAAASAKGEASAATVDRDSDGQWRARLRGYRPGKFWLEGDWGPRPESGQSRVPGELLGEWLLLQASTPQTTTPHAGRSA